MPCLSECIDSTLMQCFLGVIITRETVHSYFPSFTIVVNYSCFFLLSLATTSYYPSLANMVALRVNKFIIIITYHCYNYCCHYYHDHYHYSYYPSLLNTRIIKNIHSILLLTIIIAIITTSLLPIINYLIPLSLIQ